MGPDQFIPSKFSYHSEKLKSELKSESFKKSVIKKASATLLETKKFQICLKDKKIIKNQNQPNNKT